jgi:hypothetical protein
VGAARSVEIPVTVKGSRALVKIYSDLRLDAQDPRVWYNMGLEPTIALVNPPPPPSPHNPAIPDSFAVTQGFVADFCFQCGARTPFTSMQNYHRPGQSPPTPPHGTRPHPTMESSLTLHT